MNLNPFWNKNRIEISRKAIHITSIMIPLTYRYILGYKKDISILILLGLLTISVIVELLRLENRNFRKYFRLFFGIMLRKHERNDFTGASYLLTSALLCVAFLSAADPHIAFLAMAFLSIGDTFAAIIGMNFGKRTFIHSKKSIEGSIACFVSTFLFGICTLPTEMYPDAIHRMYPVVFVGAMAASVAEAVNIPIDDNVKIPILSGIAMIGTWLFI